jgi:hypothetical protein
LPAGSSAERLAVANGSKALSLRLKGNDITKASYPLKPFAHALNEAIGVFEDALVVLLGDGASKGAKRAIKPRGGLQKDGSLIQEFSLDVEGAIEALLPAGIEDKIWDATLLSYEYILGSARQRALGSQPGIDENKTLGMVSIQFGERELLVPNSIYQAEKRFRRRFVKLSSLVGEDVDEVSLFDVKRSIVFTAEERSLLNPLIENQKEIYVSGNVISFNKESNHGKVQVGPDEVLPPGNYGFIVAGKQNKMPFILAMIRKEARLRVIPQYEVYNTGIKVLHRLLALDIQSTKGEDEPSLF